MIEQVIRLRFKNTNNNLWCYVALLRAGFDAIGRPRFLGVIQKQSYTDTEEPKLMKPGTEIGMDLDGMLMGKQLIRFPTKTIVPLVSLKRAEEMRANSIDPNWRAKMGWEPLNLNN